MYAIIQTGGKQYRVQAGDILQIEKLAGDKGASVTFDQVLFLSTPSKDKSEVQIGKPFVKGATVQAEIVGQGRDKKIVIMKHRRRKGYKKTQGHRQEQTQVLVTLVDNGSGKKVNLSDADKKTKLDSFQSLLAPKGLAFTPKTLGSRVRMKGGPEKKVQSKPKKKAAPAPKQKTTKKAKAAAKKAAGKKKLTTKKAAAGATKKSAAGTTKKSASAAGTTKKAATTKKKASE